MNVFYSSFKTQILKLILCVIMAYKLCTLSENIVTQPFHGTSFNIMLSRGHSSFAGHFDL